MRPWKGRLVEVAKLGAGEEGVAKMGEGVGGVVVAFVAKGFLVEFHRPGEFIFGRGARQSPLIGLRHEGFGSAVFLAQYGVRHGFGLIGDEG